MKTPICSFDARTGTLCTRCEAKLHSGHISEADIEGAIRLTKLAEREQEVNKFTMVSGSKVDDDFILSLRGSDIIFLRANPSIITKIEDEFKSKVWLIEAEANDKRFIENLFFPLRVLAINLVWLPDGNKLTRVVIAGSNKSRSTTQITKIQKITSMIKNIELLVEFESIVND